MADRVNQSPLAITSKGDVLVGTGYALDLHTLVDVVKAIHRGEIAGRVFVGIVLDGPCRLKALKAMDDVAAEIAATAKISRGTPAHTNEELLEVLAPDLTAEQRGLLLAPETTTKEILGILAYIHEELREMVLGHVLAMRAASTKK